MGREIASCPAHATQTPHRLRPLLRRHHPYSRMFALLSPLVTTLAMHTPPGAAPGSQTRAAAAVSGRRDVLAGAGATAALALLGGLPGRAEASYALYQASQDSYIDRKKTNACLKLWFCSYFRSWMPYRERDLPGASDWPKKAPKQLTQCAARCSCSPRRHV